MQLCKWFQKHLGKSASPSTQIDGLFIDEKNEIREINHELRPSAAPEYPVAPGNLGKLPTGYVELTNNAARPYGKHIVTEATGLKVLELTGAIHKAQEEITSLLSNEPEPPAPEPTDNES